MSERTERPRPPVSLDIHQILGILPHRYPFVMVDRVTEILPGKSIRGHKCVSINEPWFPGHFPQRPIMPGVLILECLAQIGGILAYASDPFDPTTNLMFFLGIDKAKFRHTVTPGDRLDLHVDRAPPPLQRVEAPRRGQRRRDPLRRGRAPRLHRGSPALTLA